MFWIAIAYLTGMALHGPASAYFGAVGAWPLAVILGIAALSLWARGAGNHKGLAWPSLLLICLLCGFVRAAAHTPVQGALPGHALFTGGHAIGEWLGEGIDATSMPQHSTYIRSILLGERTGLPQELKDGYSRAGITHILSVSGLHVAFVAAVLHLLFSRFLSGRGWLLALVQVLGVGLYAYACGGTPPVLRAALMTSFACLGPALDRRVDGLSSLAMAAILGATLDPSAVTGVSFLLSYTAAASLFMLAPVLQYQFLGKDGKPNWLLGSLIVSMAATIGTLPLISMHFAQVSVIGPITNLFAVPVSGAVVILGLLQAVLGHGPTTPIGMALGATNGLVIDLLNHGARLAASPAAASITIPSLGIPGVIGAYALILLACGALSPGVFPGSKRVGRLRFVTGAAAVAVVLMAFTMLRPVMAPRGPTATFIDVGQGDCILLRSGNGDSILVDSGPKGYREGGWDAGLRKVLPTLRKMGVSSLKAIILTHADLDHIGGAGAVIGGVRVGAVLTGPYESDSPYMEELVGLIRERGIPMDALDAGDSLRLGNDMRIRVLAPAGEDLRAGESDASAENALSVVMMVEGPTKRLLMTADIDTAVEERLVDRLGVGLDADVLKVGHHGSPTSTGDALLGAVSPDTAIISVGRNNRYGHPGPGVVARLRKAGAEVRRTDETGNITIGL